MLKNSFSISLLCGVFNGILIYAFVEFVLMEYYYLRRFAEYLLIAIFGGGIFLSQYLVKRFTKNAGWWKLGKRGFYSSLATTFTILIIVYGFMNEAGTPNLRELFIFIVCCLGGSIITGVIVHFSFGSLQGGEALDQHLFMPDENDAPPDDQ